MNAATSVPNPHASAGPPTDPRTQLYRRVYALRVLGMGLGGLPVAAVLFERHAAWPAWVWTVLACLAWPHVAYLLARHSARPDRAETRNLLADSFIAGTCAPLMHFNLLPSVVLMSVVAADKLTTGIRGLLPRSLLWTVAGIAGAGLFTGFSVALPSDMAVVLACLPILVIHSLLVSAISYGLVRRVQRQNRWLREMAHTDPLTGLHTRGHWEQQVQVALMPAQRTAPTTLLLVDLDEFKAINDTHGHTVGDDVLRTLGRIVKEHAPPGSIAGRLGGDEIAMVLPVARAQALQIAERLRAEVEGMRLAVQAPLRCTVSIGVAERTPQIHSSRDWIAAADRTLYGAKHEGRNRVGGMAPTERGQSTLSRMRSPHLPTDPAA